MILAPVIAHFKKQETLPLIPAKAVVLRDAGLRPAPQDEGNSPLHPEERREAPRHEGRPEEARSAVMKDAPAASSRIHVGRVSTRRRRRERLRLLPLGEGGAERAG